MSKASPIIKYSGFNRWTFLPATNSEFALIFTLDLLAVRSLLSWVWQVQMKLFSFPLSAPPQSLAPHHTNACRSRTRGPDRCLPSSPSASPEDSSLQRLQLSCPNPPCWRESCCCQGAQHRNRPFFVLGSGAEGSLELLLNSLFNLPAQFLSIHGIKFSSLLDLKLRREILACKSLIPSRTLPYQVLGSTAWP